MNEGLRIKARREELNLSQEELAKKTGYKSRSSINKIELGHQLLTQRKIKAFADALEVSVNYILGIEEMPELKLSAEERRIILALRNADDVTRKNICKLLDIEKAAQ